MSRARVVLLAALLALAAGAIGPGPQAAGAHGSWHIDTSWRNPVVPVTAAGTDTPDPWIFRWRGRYWLTYTTGQWIEVRSAKRLAGLAAARPTRLWPRLGSTEPADRCCELWAPEIHRLRGPRGPRWYVYYAAKGASDGLVHRLYVLESARDDPAGPYRFRGQLRVPQVYAIDATVASIRGRTYLIYSGGSTFAPTSLYLARLSDPWTVSGTPIEISRPTLPWETIPFAINEGPEFLLHGGSLHVIYSASWCGTGAYKLGRLTVPRNADLLDPATWSGAKDPDPVFQSAPDRGVYGPGHGSFFTSPDGRESWMVYHATDDDRGCFTGGCAPRARSASPGTSTTRRTSAPRSRSRPTSRHRVATGRSPSRRRTPCAGRAHPRHRSSRTAGCSATRASASSRREHPAHSQRCGSASRGRAATRSACACSAGPRSASSPSWSATAGR